MNKVSYEFLENNQVKISEEVITTKESFFDVGAVRTRVAEINDQIASLNEELAKWNEVLKAVPADIK